METQRQTSLGCLRSTPKPVVGLIFQSTLLLRRAPFCPCPTSVAVNWDFCPHGAYILLRLRHLISKWVNVYQMVVHTMEENLSMVLVRGNAGIQQTCWVGRESLPLVEHLSSDVHELWVRHIVIGKSTLGSSKAVKKKTAWHCHAVVKGPMWPEWSKLGSHRRWG